MFGLVRSPFFLRFIRWRAKLTPPVRSDRVPFCSKEAPMPRPVSVSLLCRIRPGGFSGERIVGITCSDGSEHISMAPRHYCWTREQKPLGPHEPAPGKIIDGLV